MSRTLSRDEVRAAADWLHAKGIRFVVVGGSAIEVEVGAGTRDVDVLVMIAEWPEIVQVLAANLAATPLVPDEGQLRGTTIRLPGSIEPIDLEFISAEPFCGSKTPDEFVEYVRRYHTRRIGDVLYAVPGVVWYIRLSIDAYWSSYIWKIRREVASGVSADKTFRTVLEIARRFGAEEKIRERVAEARRTFDLYSEGDLGGTGLPKGLLRE